MPDTTAEDRWFLHLDECFEHTPKIDPKTLRMMARKLAARGFHHEPIAPSEDWRERVVPEPWTAPSEAATITTVEELRALQGAEPVVITDGNGNALQWHPSARRGEGRWLKWPSDLRTASEVVLPVTLLVPRIDPTDEALVERCEDERAWHGFVHVVGGVGTVGCECGERFPNRREWGKHVTRAVLAAAAR